MASTAEDLYKIHSEQRTKLIYYSMGMAVAAVGFAVFQTVSAVMSWQLVPWGIAVLCWLVSIWYGLKALAHGIGMLRLEVQKLMAMGGVHPVTGEAMEDWQKERATKIIGDQLKTLVESSNKPFDRQRSFLIAGVLVFIVWHLWRIAHSSGVVLWGFTA